MTPLQMFIPHALEFFSELAEMSGAKNVTIKEVTKEGFIFCWLVNDKDQRITPIIGISKEFNETSLN